MKQTPILSLEHRRAIAYHEAGHAAMNWLFGNEFDILSIEMRGTKVADACVWFRRTNYAALITGMERQSRRFFTTPAKMTMMQLLAGHAAESRVDEPDWQHWLDAEIDLGEYECIDNGDIIRALRLAKALRGDNGHAWAMLRRMAAWTDEALSHPRLWAVVDALAKRLETVKTRLSGRTAVAVMDAAWGEQDGYFRYGEMGATWRRRLPLTT